jgi:hypothetical protein
MSSTVKPIRILNDLTALIHPDLHQAGMSALETLRTDPDTAALAKEWTSVFTGIAVVSNRRTKKHRDGKSKLNWYDVLVSLGTQDSAIFGMPELGLKMLYKPGTVVALSGSIFLHEVGDWGEGDRVCYAFFMRAKVLEQLGEDSLEWGNCGIYED